MGEGRAESPGSGRSLTLPGASPYQRRGFRVGPPASFRFFRWTTITLPHSFPA
jgi:hypothetical protein